MEWSSISAGHVRFGEVDYGRTGKSLGFKIWESYGFPDMCVLHEMGERSYWIVTDGLDVSIMTSRNEILEPFIYRLGRLLESSHVHMRFRLPLRRRRQLLEILCATSAACVPRKGNAIGWVRPSRQGLLDFDYIHKAWWCRSTSREVCGDRHSVVCPVRPGTRAVRLEDAWRSTECTVPIDTEPPRW